MQCFAALLYVDDALVRLEKRSDLLSVNLLRDRFPGFLDNPSIRKAPSLGEHAECVGPQEPLRVPIVEASVAWYKNEISSSTKSCDFRYTVRDKTVAMFCTFGLMCLYLKK
jgi:hypothetical protein